MIAEHYGLTAADPTAGLPTYKIGPVSRGDAERVIALAKDMDVACMGTFQLDPVSRGDAARLQTLAEEMDVLCTVAATDSAVSLSSYNVGPVSRGDAERVIASSLKTWMWPAWAPFEFGRSWRRRSTPAGAGQRDRRGLL